MSGARPDGPGSREPSPYGLGPSGFDPSRVLDFEPRIAGVEFGPERSLRWLVERYYSLHLSEGSAAEASAEYLRQVTEAMREHASEPVKRAEFWMRNSKRHREHAHVNQDCYLRLLAEHSGTELPPAFRDSDGRPKGGDGEAGSVHDGAGPKNIAQPLGGEA